MSPFALSASATLKKSSNVAGACRLLSAKSFLLYQSTFARWMLTGTDQKWPLAETMSSTPFGKIWSHFWSL